MSSELAEDIDITAPHTRHEHAAASEEPLRRFAPRSSPLPSDFVEELLRADDAYNPELAYALAVIAGWSYSDARTLADKLKYYQLPEVVVEAIAVTNPAMLIVASAFLVRSKCGRLGLLSFRGTEPTNAINWLTDTDVVEKPFGKGLVHQGFFANLEAVWEVIVRKLEQALQPADGKRRKPLERLYITGHSLGGGMAVLAAARLMLDDGSPLRGLLHGVYTFGQPAVGNADFVDEWDPQFGSRLHRHIYAHDVVPHLPPAWGARFRHFGSERVAASSNEPWRIAKTPLRQARLLVLAAASCATSFVTRRLPVLDFVPLPYSLDDHSPARYIEVSRASLP
jgi:Lipase (class 3)